MESKRKHTREKRYKNRLRIAGILFLLCLIVAVASWFITRQVLLVSGFMLIAAIAYLIAGLWERKELKNQDQ